MHNRPMGRSREFTSTQKRFCTAASQSGSRRSTRKHKQFPLYDSGSIPQAWQAFLFQQGHVHTPAIQSSFLSFADVASHGISCNRTHNLHVRPSSPNYAKSLRAAFLAAPPPPAAALPPPIAPWVLGPAGCFRDSAGACAVCGTACSRARAVGRGTAAFDDPFRSDWPHW
jgi:hypothetical protein